MTYIIEGQRAVEEAINSDKLIEIFVSDDYYKGNHEFLDNLTAEINIVDEKLFLDITDTENSQGILATMKFDTFKLDDIRKGTYILVDGIRDPGNLGGIIRSIDAFNLDGLIIGPETVDVLNEKVVRSTMGSILRTRIFYLDNFENLEMLKSRGMKVLASSLYRDSVDIREIESFENSIIIIGSEAFGIGPESKSLADKLIHIGMEGQAESLNANVAASIIMYEVKR